MGGITVRQDNSGQAVTFIKMSDQVGKSVLEQEAQAILNCANLLGQSFQLAVDQILDCHGRVICCGVGKSGHIARKTAATLASTGTPSFFMHATEAVHGDLGMVTGHDIVLLYTHSGETDELVRLFPSFTAVGAKTILITGRPTSSAARLSDLVLDTAVKEEACPNNLAPTTSTTVMLALSDALAVAVLDRRGFTRDDFAKFHPAGSLGKQLLLRVQDIMRTGDDLALVRLEDTVVTVMQKIAKAGVGAAIVIDDEQNLLGFVTEGDLRRHLLRESGSGNSAIHARVATFMNPNPSTLEPSLMAMEALEVFQNHPKQIGESPVVESGKVVGLLMLKDLLRSGII